MLEKVQVTGKLTLREIRALHGMTQKEFAEYVGINYETYRRYEADLKGADFVKIASLCEIVGIKMDSIAI